MRMLSKVTSVVRGADGRARTANAEFWLEEAAIRALQPLVNQQINKDMEELAACLYPLSLLAALGWYT